MTNKKNYVAGNSAAERDKKKIAIPNRLAGYERDFEQEETAYRKSCLFAGFFIFLTWTVMFCLFHYDIVSFGFGNVVANLIISFVVSLIGLGLLGAVRKKLFGEPNLRCCRCKKKMSRYTHFIKPEDLKRRDTGLIPLPDGTVYMVSEESVKNDHTRERVTTYSFGLATDIWQYCDRCNFCFLLFPRTVGEPFVFRTKNEEMKKVAVDALFSLSSLGSIDGTFSDYVEKCYRQKNSDL